MRFRDLMLFILSIFICFLAGFIGSIFMNPALTGWYAELNKPPFTPPNEILTPVWIILYFLMGIALFIIWSQGGDDDEVRMGLFLFGVQMVLNVVWSFVFFGLKSLPGGMVVIVLLWFVILLTINSFFRVSELAGWLLLPCIVWVSLTAVVNIGLLVLN